MTGGRLGARTQGPAPPLPRGIRKATPRRSVPHEPGLRAGAEKAPQSKLCFSDPLPKSLRLLSWLPQGSRSFQRRPALGRLRGPAGRCHQQSGLRAGRCPWVLQLPSCSGEAGTRPDGHRRGPRPCSASSLQLAGPLKSRQPTPLAASSIQTLRLQGGEPARLVSTTDPPHPASLCCVDPGALALSSPSSFPPPPLNFTANKERRPVAMVRLHHKPRPKLQGAQGGEGKGGPGSQPPPNTLPLNTLQQDSPVGPRVALIFEFAPQSVLLRGWCRWAPQGAPQRQAPPAPSRRLSACWVLPGFIHQPSC